MIKKEEKDLPGHKRVRTTNSFVPLVLVSSLFLPIALINCDLVKWSSIINYRWSIHWRDWKMSLNRCKKGRKKLTWGSRRSCTTVLSLGHKQRIIYAPLVLVTSLFPSLTWNLVSDYRWLIIKNQFADLISRRSLADPAGLGCMWLVETRGQGGQKRLVGTCNRGSKNLEK